MRCQSTILAAAPPNGASDSCNSGLFDCNICFDVAGEPVITRCGHLYCDQCIERWMCECRARCAPSTCPICKVVIASPQSMVRLRSREAESRSSSGDAGSGIVQTQADSKTVCGSALPESPNSIAYTLPRGRIQVDLVPPSIVHAGTHASSVGQDQLQAASPKRWWKPYEGGALPQYVVQSLGFLSILVCVLFL